LCKLVVRAALGGDDEDDDDDDQEDEEEDDDEQQSDGGNFDDESEPTEPPKPDDQEFLLRFVRAGVFFNTVEELSDCLDKRSVQCSAIWGKLEDHTKALKGQKKALLNRTASFAGAKAALQVTLVLDTKSLALQKKTIQRSKRGTATASLTDFLKLVAELEARMNGIEKQLKRLSSNTDAFAAPEFVRWSQRAADRHKNALRALTGDLAERRLAEFLSTQLDSASGYDLAFLADFGKIISTDARQMARDRKELEYLELQMGGLLEPITNLNWEDALESWINLIGLCGTFRGERSQCVHSASVLFFPGRTSKPFTHLNIATTLGVHRGVLRQILDDERLLKAVGMVSHLRSIEPGPNGTQLPHSMMHIFKSDVAAVSLEQSSCNQLKSYILSNHIISLEQSYNLEQSSCRSAT
jgi:hypothetical protein